MPTRSTTTSRALVLASLTGCAFLGCVAQADDDRGPLLFADEFDGTEIDQSIWSHQIGTGQFGWGNNELQYYTARPENSRVEDGKLVITAREESFAGSPYTSARMRTINKFDFRYGVVEARIKLPSTEGIWPAFWMMPTDSVYGVWAASGELDVMESVNQADRVYGTAHFGGTWPENTSNGSSFADGTDWSADFHVYTMKWTPRFIEWFVDDRLYHRMTFPQWFSNSDPGNPLAPFDERFHLILNVAVGGNFPGYPDDRSVFPQTMEVDWVRVYELPQSPFGGTPIAVPGAFEAEDFDQGFNGSAYFDRSNGNSGGEYRTDIDVDIVASSGGGHHVTGIQQDEWLEYTVNIAQAGTYELRVRASSPQNACLARLELDGETLGDPLLILPTGGDENWTVATTEVTLPAGEHVIRWVTDSFDSPQYNLDSFELVFTGAGCQADWNADGAVNVLDVVSFIVDWGQGVVDFNGDGAVNVLDIVAFINTWNDGCA